MGNLVTVQNNQVIVSSRQIAESFGKRHADVIKAIEKHKEDLHSTDFSVQWFYVAVYKDSTGKSCKEYLMNRDGFTLLAMSFTGSKAMQWKLKYIEAFNEMEKQLAKTQLPDFTNPVIAARAWADAVEGKQLAETKVERLAPKAAITEAFIEKKHAVGFRELAKELSIKESILRNFLIETGIAYRQNDKWKPYALMVEKGYMVVKDVQNNQNGYITAQALWTMGGKEFVRQKLRRVGIIAA